MYWTKRSGLRAAALGIAMAGCSGEETYSTPPTLKGDPITATWIGGSGDWSDESNWNISGGWGIDLVIPPQPLIRYIDAGNPIHSVVRLGRSATAIRLVIDEDDILSIQDDGDLIMIPLNQNSILSNSGMVVLDGQSASSILRITNSGTLRLDGGGYILLHHPTRSRIVGDAGGEYLMNVDNIISGAGLVGMDGIGIANFGIIDADTPYEVLRVDPDNRGMINTGILRATNAGRLALVDATIYNEQGVISAAGGSRVDLEGTTILGGQLTTSGNGLIQTMTSSVFWVDVTNHGRFELGPTSLTIEGTIENQGVINVVAGDTLAQGADVVSEIIIPSGAGVVQMTGSGRLNLRSCIIRSSRSIDGDSFVNGPEHTIIGDGRLGFDSVSLINQGTLIADGLRPIVVNPPASQRVLNEGHMVAQGAGGFVLTDGTFYNDGIIEVLDGSRCVFTSAASVDNVANSALTGGTWIVSSKGEPSLLLVAEPSVFFNQADVTLSGRNASFPLIHNILVNVGRLALQNGRDFTAQGSFFSNSGELSIGSDCQFDVFGTFFQDEGGEIQLAIDLADPNQQPSVIVYGAASIHGTLRVDVNSTAAGPVKKTVVLLTANSISGSFDQIVTAPGVTVSVLSSQVTATFAPVCLGDVDGNRIVDIDDLLSVVSQWGPCPAMSVPCEADLTGDNVVDTDDLLLILSHWGVCSLEKSST